MRDIWFAYDNNSRPNEFSGKLIMNGVLKMNCYLRAIRQLGQLF